MYGYIRPHVDELRVNEYKRFRTAYCGVCEALRHEYGLTARFLVSYDMTFLAMLSLQGTELPEGRRCPVHPFRKLPCVCGNDALIDAADFSVILAYEKLRDDAADESGFASLRAKIAKSFLKRAYRKASAKKPALSENTAACLAELAKLEADGSASLDETADCFARLLAFSASDAKDSSTGRVRAEILYHIGRAVYILDAVDDFAEDRRKGRFNPLCVRYAGDTLSDEEKKAVRGTLNASLSRAMSAAELLPDTAWKPIIENTISLGVPASAEAVFAGTWNKNTKKTEDL